jgi:hypothetical protein
VWSDAGPTPGSSKFEPGAVPSVAEPDSRRHTSPKVVAELDGFELYACVATAYLLTKTAVLSLILEQSFLVGSDVQ